MRQNKEYIICRQIAQYLRIAYPSITFHFDLAGLNLSRAQAGMMKGIQGGRGWPDLFIAQQSFQGEFKGLFLEIKTEGTRLHKKSCIPATPHIGEQLDMIIALEKRGYQAHFVCGFNEAKAKIDAYLKL
jgi:hypothetical protein